MKQGKIAFPLHHAQEMDRAVSVPLLLQSAAVQLPRG